MANTVNAGSQRAKRGRIMHVIKINEISGVDVPAQEGAVAVIMKRKGSPDYKPGARDPVKRGRAPDPQKDEFDVEKGAALTTANDGHTHLVSLTGFNGDEVNSGQTSWVDDHVHPWIRNEDGDIVIGAAHAPDDGVSHDHSIGEMSKLAEDAGAAGEVGQEEDNPVATDDKTKKAAPTVEQLQAQLARANSVASLNDAEKVHLETLKDDGAGEFLAKSADDRKVVLEKLAKAAKDEDPVVYTTKDGVELRKSVGAGFIAIAKSNDVLRDEVTKLTTERADADLAKRAETELSHIPGTLETRTEMLKAIEGIKDDTAREASLNALKAQNEAMSKAFITAGHGGVTIPGSPGDELDKLAKAYHDKHPDLTIEQSYTEVTMTEQGSELYAKSVN